MCTNISIAGNNAYSTKLYLKVIKALRYTPALQWLLCTKLLNLINGTFIELRLRNIYDLIKEGDCLSISAEAALDESQDMAMSFTQHYPCVTSVKRKACSGISDIEYIGLLRTAFKTYVKIYHINEINLRLKKGPTLDVDLMEHTRDVEREELRAMAKKPTNWEAMESQLEANPSYIMERTKNWTLFPFVKTNWDLKRQLIDNIDMQLDREDIQRYRDDIKYHDVIKMMLTKANHPLLSDWFDVEASLND